MLRFTQHDSYHHYPLFFAYGQTKNGLNYPLFEVLDNLYIQTSKSARTNANAYLILECMKMSSFQKSKNKAYAFFSVLF